MAAEARSRVIVTGAAGLIGRALTARLTTIGYDVVELDLSLGHDLSDARFVADWFERNRAEHLVNLFAINDAVVRDRQTSSFLDVDLDAVKRCLDVNVVALLSVCREFIRNQRNGTIVNFSSIYGVGSPKPNLYSSGEKFIGYGVSKAAVIQLTRHLAVHAAPSFRVNCVVPGGVFDGQPEDFVEKYSKETPLGRMMSPQEVPGVVEFLLSEQASYCSGGVFTVDGGWTAW
jgi:NAD(P)-dependent dehydrogenase (short-subunit alcohol dehydrogenase family)